MSHHVKFNLKWCLLTVFVSVSLFKVLVYPWLGYLEGKIWPVFSLEQEDYFNVQVDDTKFVGGVVVAKRECDLISITFYNVKEDGIKVLYTRENEFLPVPYSIGTKASFGMFTFKPAYFGETLTDIRVKTVSSCHPIWDTVTVNNLKS